MGLLQKLQVKDPGRFSLINSPQELHNYFTDEGLAGHQDLSEYREGGVLLFVENSENLNNSVDKFLSDPAADNHWVAFPKKNSKIPTDLGRDNGWESLTDRGWLPVRQISINDNWSALRFRMKTQIKEIRRGTDYPGIDRKTKTVEIPGSLLERLESEGLTSQFEALSFTNRKEYVIGILDAKRDETREKRINKVISDLST